jgi:hypothetical protein
MYAKFQIFVFIKQMWGRQTCRGEFVKRTYVVPSALHTPDRCNALYRHGCLCGMLRKYVTRNWIAVMLHEASVGRRNQHYTPSLSGISTLESGRDIYTWFIKFKSSPSWQFVWVTANNLSTAQVTLYRRIMKNVLLRIHFYNLGRSNHPLRIVEVQYRILLNTDLAAQYHIVLNTHLAAQYHNAFNTDFAAQYHNELNSDLVAQYHILRMPL